MLHQEKVSGTDPEHHQGMAIQSIAEATPPALRQIFLYGECVDVADAATLQIAGAGVMRGMHVLPVVIGRQGDDAEARARPSR